VSAYLTQSHYTLGDQAAAIRSAEQAAEVGRTLPDRRLQIIADFGLGQAHHVLGDYRAAQRHLGQVVAAVEGDLARERWGMAGLVSVAARIWLAASLADTGDFEDALARAREGIALGEGPEHPWSLSGAYMTVGFVLLSRGQPGEAAPVLDRGIAFSREMDITAWLPMLLCARGLAHVRTGDVVEGVRMLEDGVGRASALRILSRQALRLSWLAEGYLRAGRVDAAAEVAAQAYQLAEQHGERGYAAIARRMLGETVARAGERGRAEEHYADALARARALEMRPLEALCLLGLGELARDAGSHAAATERLTAARGLLRAMEMHYWLPAVEAALRER
jgi:tetratricopeptide (TPR) repeat protein